MTGWTIYGLVTATSLLTASNIWAQEIALPDPASAQERPPKVNDNEPNVVLDFEREIDLANIVTSAAKGVTSVQEAPAIITIITAEDIKARGHKFIGEALATVPGWLDIHELGNQGEVPMVRGVTQAFLLLRDGLSLFDPFSNIAWVTRTQPVETIKRIEVVTGPGGVLWGANSFLGVSNLITKDAEDVNGLEFSANYGDGAGNKQDFKLFGLFGRTFLDGRLKIFQHVSYESFIGTVFNYPQVIADAPAPQPSGTVYFGANSPHDPPRSWFIVVDGKYSLGPISLYYMVPFGDVHPNLGLANTVNSGSTWNTYDRYGMLEYKSRFARERFGISIRGYGAQFVRDFTPNLLPPSLFFPKEGPNDLGGLVFTFNQKILRLGSTVDLDLALPFNIRLLAGAEFFYEGVSQSAESFASPLDSSLLPLVCPVNSAGMPLPGCRRVYATDTGRYVTAGYFDAQWRLLQKLTLDAGVRIQKGFGNLPYNLVPLGSGALVYSILPDIHVKINYATGFRPPVFNNTSISAGGIAYGSNPKLETESSKSFQGELNARLLHNVRRVRELEVRADYSYTILSNVIQIREGIYDNTGKRAIHSAEGYAKLYLAGDHFLQASYTYLYSVTTDSGVIRTTPNHWFVIGASFNLVKDLLDVNGNLAILGAYEDTNRFPSEQAGAVGGAYSTSTTSTRSSDLTWDRLTPVANLQLGFRLRLVKYRLQISGQFYNVLNQRYYYPDNFGDLTPTVEIHPDPAPGFNFYSSVAYRF